jgi:hypothetical protein
MVFSKLILTKWLKSGVAGQDQRVDGIGKKDLPCE